MSYSRILKHSKFIVKAAWAVLALICIVGGATFAEPTTDEPMVEESIRITAPIAPQTMMRVAETCEPIQEPIPEYIITSLGEFRLTAYCACEKCCNHWATNRPTDENGNPIIYTASGAIATQGVTVAADTNIFPFGTVLLIDGSEYIVQDRGGAIKGKSIDVYFDSHEDAKQFGLKYREIFIREKNNVT